MKFEEQLRRLNACEDAVAWVGNRDLQTAWAECPRGDWMLWWARSGADIRAITLAKGRIADLVRRRMADDRSINAYAYAYAYARARGAGAAEAKVYAAASTVCAYADAATYAEILAAAADICREVWPVPPGFPSSRLSPKAA